VIYLVESPEFREILSYLQVQDNDIPRRTKVTGAIIDAWGVYFDVLKKALQVSLSRFTLRAIFFITHQDAPGRISFTADIWSNQSRYPFLAVTAHWIERDESTHHLKLQAALIAFHRLRGSHNGPRLARIVLHILDRVGVTEKVCGLYFIVVIGANHGLGGSLDP
jgi:hypothetical protein